MLIVEGLVTASRTAVEGAQILGERELKLGVKSSICIVGSVSILARSSECKLMVPLFLMLNRDFSGRARTERLYTNCCGFL
jgi:hypothetical protein